MPNKTLYIRESDLPLFEQAQQNLGDSISSVFADFLRERVKNLTPEEGRILAFIEQARRGREQAADDRSLPRFLQMNYAVATAEAEKALKSFRGGDIRQTKIHFYAANS